MSEIRHAIGKVDFNTAYDFLRAAAVEMVERGEIDRAVNSLQEIDALITRNGAEEEDRPLLDIHAALMQILTALYIEKGRDSHSRHHPLAPGSGGATQGRAFPGHTRLPAL